MSPMGVSAVGGRPASSLRYHRGVSRTVDAGLCGQCAWSRRVPAAVSTFIMCTRALTDAAFAKYPPLPVRACRGFEPAPSRATSSEESR
jgi:hypothetical protein